MWYKCAKALREILSDEKTHTSPFPRRACPWLEQGRESSANRARNAHIRAMAPAGDSANPWPSAFPSIRHEGARSARFIRWIPACAGMARWRHGSGGVGFIRWMPAGFLHRLEIGNPVEKERGTCILFTGFLPLQEWQNGDHRKGGGRAARMVVRHVFNQDYS